MTLDYLGIYVVIGNNSKGFRQNYMSSIFFWTSILKIQLGLGLEWEEWAENQHPTKGKIITR